MSSRGTVEKPHRLKVERGLHGLHRYTLLNPDESRVIATSQYTYKRDSDAVAAARNKFDWLRILVVERPSGEREKP